MRLQLLRHPAAAAALRLARWHSPPTTCQIAAEFVRKGLTEASIRKIKSGIKRGKHVPADIGRQRQAQAALHAGQAQRKGAQPLRICWRQAAHYLMGLPRRVSECGWQRPGDAGAGMWNAAPAPFPQRAAGGNKVSKQVLRWVPACMDGGESCCCRPGRQQAAGGLVMPHADGHPEERATELSSP